MIEFNKALKEIDEMIKVHDIVQKRFSILREKYLSIYSITYWAHFEQKEKFNNENLNRT